MVGSSSSVRVMNTRNTRAAKADIIGVPVITPARKKRT
jgi:hypothetical protein